MYINMLVCPLYSMELYAACLYYKHVCSKYTILAQTAEKYLIAVQVLECNRPDTADMLRLLAHTFCVNTCRVYMSKLAFVCCHVARHGRYLQSRLWCHIPVMIELACNVPFSVPSMYVQCLCSLWAVIHARQFKFQSTHLFDIFQRFFKSTNICHQPQLCLDPLNRGQL